jgi:hypothetical protein
MDVFFLSADRKLTKTFTVDEVTPYPLVKNFTSHHASINSISGFYKAVVEHGELGHCLIKGELLRDLKLESRAGATSATDATDWVCFDIDGLPISEVEKFIYLCLPEACHNVSYVVQYSASYVARGDRGGLSAHVFMLLDTSVGAPALREWLRELNVTNSVLFDALSLNPAGTTLKFRLDPTVAQNDKIIYISAPICKGFEPKLPQHIKLVTKKQGKLSIDLSDLNPSRTDEVLLGKLNTLRKAAGLKIRKPTFKGEVMTNPDRVVQYEAKEERGFVYFNLNGGNSWGYFHPEEDASVIYNFKGEPPYSTAALLPDYWHQLQVEDKQAETGFDYFVGRDIRSAGYFNGWQDKSSGKLTIFPARSKEQLQDFMQQHGYIKPDVVPDYQVVFNRSLDTTFDRDNRIINLYQPSTYMAAATKKPGARIPDTIAKVINHAMGGQPDVVEHYLNWLAVICQQKVMAQTAWVLHGTQGTGKGLLVNHVLRPIIGSDYVKVMQLATIEEDYNPWLERCVLLVIDEASVEDASKVGKMMQKIKNWITEPSIWVRPMHAQGYNAPNNMSLMVLTNMHDPVVIHHNDRRFNVATRQMQPISISPKEVNAIAGELQAFADYLMTREANLEKAREVLDTPEREQMKELTQTSVAVSSRKLLEGDLDFFIVNAPPSMTLPNMKTYNGVSFDVNRAYLDVIDRAVARDGMIKLSRTDIFALLEHTVGNVPPTPNKLTSLLKHQEMRLSRLRLENGELDYGFELRFEVTREHRDWVHERKSKNDASKRLRAVDK